MYVLLVYVFCILCFIKPSYQLRIGNMVPKLTEHPGLLKEMENFRPEDSYIGFPNWDTFDTLKACFSKTLNVLVSSYSMYSYVTFRRFGLSLAKRRRACLLKQKHKAF